MDDKAAQKAAKRIVAFIVREQEKSGMNPTQFSKKSGIARTCIYNWSTGLFIPNILTVIMALDAFGYELKIRRKRDAERNDGAGMPVP